MNIYIYIYVYKYIYIHTPYAGLIYVEAPQGQIRKADTWRLAVWFQTRSRCEIHCDALECLDPETLKRLRLGASLLL